MDLTGIHHLTAISARIRDNKRFFTGTLGMRLVKRSVNQDDVSAYHLFYADGRGTPGTDITFFDWPLPPERRGTHAITRTHLRVAGEAALAWWSEALEEAGVRTEPIAERGGRVTLPLEDPEGQRLTLVDDEGEGDAHPWDGSPVPKEFQVRGLGPIVLSVPELAPTDALLTRVLNMRKIRDYPHPDGAQDLVHVYEMGPGGAGAELHVAEQPGLPPARQGAGGVHHVAFRTPTFDEYDAWLAHLNAHRVRNSGPVDRFWFRSLYFREPNGILFEIATDGPGFAVDEDESALGSSVVLPPHLEEERGAIVAALEPLD
jgi:glyoxalase family protein